MVAGSAAVTDGAGGVSERVDGSERLPDPLVGTVINSRFLVEKALAHGGMGRVYYGRQRPLDRPVALKIVKADTLNEEESQFLKRFLLEASILAKLQHPNVVTLFDYGRIEGAPVEMYFIAMEYLAGETLSKRLRVRGALPVDESLVLFRQIARGLREAHLRGVVHRDLKPSNIIIVPEPDGEIVKLVDFGIGKLDSGGEDLTRKGVLVGTPRYMAPEQFGGESSSASDVYALGTIVYQTLTGVLPFAGTSEVELILAKLQRAVTSMRVANGPRELPESLESLVQQMLARSPTERPTLDGVFAQLSACEEEIFGKPISLRSISGASAPISTGGKTVPPSSRSITPPPNVSSLLPRVSGPESAPVPSATDLTETTSIETAALRSPRRVSIAAAFGSLLLVGGAGLWATKGKTPQETTTTPSAGATNLSDRSGSPVVVSSAVPSATPPPVEASSSPHLPTVSARTAPVVTVAAPVFTPRRVPVPAWTPPPRPAAPAKDPVPTGAHADAPPATASAMKGVERDPWHHPSKPKLDDNPFK